MWFRNEREGRSLKGAKDRFNDMTRVWAIVPATIAFLLYEVAKGFTMRRNGLAVGRGERN